MLRLSVSLSLEKLLQALSDDGAPGSPAYVGSTEPIISSQKTHSGAAVALNDDQAKIAASHRDMIRTQEAEIARLKRVIEEMRSEMGKATAPVPTTKSDPRELVESRAREHEAQQKASMIEKTLRQKDEEISNLKNQLVRCMFGMMNALLSTCFRFYFPGR